MHWCGACAGRPTLLNTCLDRPGHRQRSVDRIDRASVARRLADRDYRSDPKKSIGQMLETAIEENGIEAAVATYTELLADSTAASEG